MALVNPQRTSFGGDPVRAGTPSGLLSLAPMVERKLREIEIFYVDAQVEGPKTEIGAKVFRHGLTPEQLRARLEAVGLGKGDLVAISNLHTSEWKNAALCVEVAKQLGATVVLGGHHPTYMPEFMLRNTVADYIVRGEGEYSFVELLTAIADKKTRERDLRAIKGIAFRAGDKIVNTGRAGFIANLDDLPDPAFELLIPRLYGERFSHWGKTEGIGPIVDYAASRGCPVGCTFCTSPDMWGKEIRTFSPERVRQQIRTLAGLGFKNLTVEDDNVLMLPHEVQKAMFEELGKQDFKWVCDGGLYYPLVTQEFVDFIRANGCYRVYQPIEHPVLEIMHGRAKYRGLKEQEDVKRTLANVFDMYNKADVGFYVAIMVGFPEETQETLKVVREYAKFVKKEGAAWVSFFFVKPLPGTKDYKNYPVDPYVPEGRRWKTNPEYWTFSTPVIKPYALKIGEIYAIINDFSLEINGRPNTLVDPFVAGRRN